MTRRVDCKDHSHSEGGQERGRRARGKGGRGQGANARTKGLFRKAADQQTKLVFGMLEHPPLLSAPCLF